MATAYSKHLAHSVGSIFWGVNIKAVCLFHERENRVLDFTATEECIYKYKLTRSLEETIFFKIFKTCEKTLDEYCDMKISTPIPKKTGTLWKMLKKKNEEDKVFE